MNNQVFSKAWGLIKQDLIKVGKGLILAILGALVAFIKKYYTYSYDS